MMIKYLTSNFPQGRPALFCDRDGTLIYNRHYLADPAGVEIIPGAVEVLKQFAQAGYLLVMLSNQSGIARGYFTAEDLAAVHQRTLEVFREQGVEFAGCYYCPHGPDEGCSCRKPQPGMILAATQDLSIDLPGSLMIGDGAVDQGLAQNAGIPSVILNENTTWTAAADWLKSRQK